MLVYKALQGLASPTPPGSSPDTCPLGEPTAAAVAHTQFIPIWRFCRRCFLCMKHLGLRSSPVTLHPLCYISDTNSSEESSLSTQCLGDPPSQPIILCHITLSYTQCDMILFTVHPPNGEYKFHESRLCLEPHCYSRVLGKDLLNKCLNVAQILEYPQHLRSALKS